MRRSPLERHHPHGAGLAAVRHRGLELAVAVEVLRLRQVRGVRQVRDVPRTQELFLVILRLYEETFKSFPTPNCYS